MQDDFYRILLTIFVIGTALFGIGLLFYSPAARAHGLAEWIMWSPQTSYCCGERDCKKVPASAVREVHGGWIIVETGQQFPDGHTDLHPSIDGDFWTCTLNPPYVRCLFVPPGGA